MISLSLLIIGLALGYEYRVLRDFMREMERKHPKPETGITPGLYHKANENKTQDGETGFVSPKTPELLEWEESERLRQEQLR